MNKKKKSSGGFFLVVYMLEEKKTVYYRKWWNPSKLVSYFKSIGKEFLWIKIYIQEEDYLVNPKGKNYYRIFDKNNPVEDFNYYKFSNKTES